MNAVTSNAVFEALNNLESVILFSGNITAGDDITLSEYINHFKFLYIIDGNALEEGQLLMNSLYGNTTGRGGTITAGLTAYVSSVTPPIMTVSDIALTNTDGIHYHVERNAQINISSTGIEYFSATRTSSLIIRGYRA